MLRSRIIPLLLLDRGRLVKTTRFSSPKYVGDPINTVRLFNEKLVDEILILDISASRLSKEPDFQLLEQLSGESRMPVAYGGGITHPQQIERLISLGIEKISVSSAFLQRPSLLKEAAKIVGSQSVAVVINSVRSHPVELRWELLNSKTMVQEPGDLLDMVQLAVENDAGELIINSVDRDGTRQGFDVELAAVLRSKVALPITIAGGASGIEDFASLSREIGPLGMAAGSLFVFTGKFDSVLIQYPHDSERSYIYNSVNEIL